MFWIVLSNSYLFFLLCSFFRFLIRALLMNFTHVACSRASFHPWGFISHESWSAFYAVKHCFSFQCNFSHHCQYLLISPCITCFFSSSRFFQPAPEWIKEGCTWYLIFCRYGVRSSKQKSEEKKKQENKTEKGVNEDGKKGGKGQGDEREGGEGRGANINSCSPVHHVL